MAFEYRPRGGFASKVDETRCKAGVHKSWHVVQCTRSIWKDGWCKQHHPETENSRREAREKRWQYEWNAKDRAADLEERKKKRLRDIESAAKDVVDEWRGLGASTSTMVRLLRELAKVLEPVK